MEQGLRFSVVEYFGEIASAVSAEMTPIIQAIDPAVTGIHYLHGHPVEIIETLMQRDKSQTMVFDKYPLICLFQDFQEKWTQKHQIEATLNIVICNSTVNTLKAYERYDRNFNPILYPIFQSLLKHMVKHVNTIGYAPTYTKIDRLYWGKSGLYGNQGNIFNDYLDAIELVNFKLLVNTINC